MHIPVMLTEALEALKLQPGYWYVDGTFGGGGHTSEMLQRGAKVIAFDFDKVAIKAGQIKLADEIAQGKLILVHANFDQLEQEIKRLQAEHHIPEIAGILFDFGTSSDQLTSADRGFSFFGKDEELDMRLDDRLTVKAKDLLMVLNEKQLTELFREYGGEEQAHGIAKAIVKARKDGNFQQLQTVGGFVDLISKVKRNHHHGHLHPATKVFQALRILVNDELGNIERALPQAHAVLKPGGRLVTIAFHEGEDRAVKRQFSEWEEQGAGKIITKHPLKPTDEEVQSNSRSRSAKLRTYERT
jgi:16S rRNA (cytosine1402-N4)-methyltransferase